MKRFLCVLTAAMLLVAAVAVAEGTVQPTAAPEEMTVEQKLYEMIPILDSFARNMGVEGEFPYDSANPEFVWMQLYLECVNWGSLNPEIALPDAQMTVPAQTMLAYAQASFSGLEALPEIPESVTGVTYDAMADAYLLDMSDMGETYVVIEKYAFDEVGNLIVGFGLYNPETGRLGGFSAQLIENAMLPDGTAGAFPYAVTGVANEPEGAFEGLTPTVCEIQYVEPTPEPTPMPTPVVYSELSLGSRGEAVMALQARLNELGYDCGTVDGIFGRATKEAVRYFQDAIGEDQDGVASNALQQKLFAANAPAFVLYRQLMSGSSGIRVEKLQNRLRALGYLALPVSGEFGSRTEEAVKVFQKQAGLKVDGIAGEKTLSALYSAKAKKCDTYITLKKGDTGTRVKEMQVRLRKLGFLTKKANSVYDSDTVKAVKAFIEEIGAEGDGKTADKALLKKLFAYEPAPTATPTTEPTTEPTLEPTVEPTLEPTPEPTAEPTPEPTAEPTPEPTAEPTPEPVSVLTPEQQIAFTQAVNDALLPAIPYTDEEAVTWLQTALLIDPPTGIYDQATFDAVSALQLANSLLETGIADADVITILNVPPAP